MTRKDDRAISVLTVGGSDSGGASGIQADLKTFAACGVHGVSALTAVTAQTMNAVCAIHRVPAALLEAQLEAARLDFRIEAVKIGMLASGQSIDVLTAWLRAATVRNVVLDPVLVSSSGTALVPAAARRRIRDQLIPISSLVTPNLDEVDALLGVRVRGPAAIREAGAALIKLGAQAVLIKGGHARGKIIRDFLITRKSTQTFTHARVPISARGTGCSLASAIAAFLARGEALENAVAHAESYVQESLRRAYRPGRGERSVLGHLAKPKR